jgi:hypothetical protein
MINKRLPAIVARMRIDTVIGITSVAIDRWDRIIVAVGEHTATKSLAMSKPGHNTSFLTSTVSQFIERLLWPRFQGY